MSRAGKRKIYTGQPQEIGIAKTPTTIETLQIKNRDLYLSDAIEAFMNGTVFRHPCANTFSGQLHAGPSRIAWHKKIGTTDYFEISLTRCKNKLSFDLLNLLPDVCVYRENEKLYLNGEEWDGRLARVNRSTGETTML